jgi:hypothetical protein
MNEPQVPVQDAARQPSDALPTDELDDEDHRPIPMSRARIAPEKTWTAATCCRCCVAPIWTSNERGMPRHQIISITTGAPTVVRTQSTKTIDLVRKPPKNRNYR